MKESVYIIGAGAIGKALSVFLSRAGIRTFLVRSSVENMPVEQRNFEVLLNEGHSVSAAVDVSSLDGWESFDGVIVIANKSFANPNIAASLTTKARQSPVVIMQNGLEIEKPFLDYHFADVYRCVLFSTSQTISDSVVRFKPVSPSPIGVVTGDGQHLTGIASLLSTSHFPFTPVAEIKPIVWTKVIANCVFNSICPLLDADNGVFHRNPIALSIAEMVIDECLNVAQYAGISLDKQAVLQTVLTISKSSDGQLISTLQDINNKRPTEIDSLNFAIARIAEQFNMGDATAITKMLGEMTRLKSQLSLK